MYSRSINLYLLLVLSFSGVFASAALSQDAGKKPDDPPASQPAKTAKTITGKAHLVRAGEQTEASKGSASDVSISFYLSDDKKSIMNYSISTCGINYFIDFSAEYKAEPGHFTSEGKDFCITSTLTESDTPIITKGDFDWGKGTDYHMKGRFILPAEAKGSLHLFYTYRRTSDYREFKFDLGEWAFDAK
jgi:hypothetical protein